MVLESNTLDLLFVKDGEQGTDGKMLYTWIKYAKDDKGTDMTDDPQSAVYIGISYNNESNVESDDPTQYAWTKIQGADGKKGEDAYTIVLENENISFATDENRNPLSEQAYTSRITVMKGATPVTDFGIGDIAKTQGIAIAKGDDGISISVVNGNALPADSGEITVPISVGGTVFKKVLTWTCAKKGEQGVKGDKGDTGQKGQDGTSVKITSKSVTYQTSTSGTTAPTGTWSTTVPTVNNGQYLWTKTTVQYSDGNKTEAYSVSYKGTNGTNGTSVTVSKTEITYQVSTSGTTAPTGTWSTTMPSCDQGQYLWTKTYVKYSDGKDTTSYSVSYKGVDGEKFAFNMLRETNQGSKHWVNMGASGKYSVESITTEDSINAVKLICTKPIASNEWQFCEFSDYEMLKSLKASTTYTLSYDIKTNRSGKISHNIKTGGGQKPFFANDISCKVLGNETWEHVSLKMTSGTTLPNLDGQVIYMFDNALSKVGYSIIKNLKLTEGIVDTPWAPHPEDLEGRGVSETIQYYLATSQASGVTSSISGWSTDITTQKLTADKKYLWNCYQTKYSDDTSEPISTPKVIGVYGDKGNGIVASVQRPNKTEFWWSQVGAVGHKDTFDDSSNTRNNCRVGDIFTVMGTSTEGNSHTVYYKSTTDSGDLAGECINHVIAESGADAKNLSITPSSQYFKSTDGGKTFAPDTITIKPTIQGEINFGKWQYSIDGGVSFADVVSGQKGLTISNNVLTVSKDSGLYSDAVTMVTFRAVASDSSFYDTCSIAKIYDVSDIGDGRNLWITRDNITLQACEKDKYIYTTTGTSAVCIGADVSSVGTNTIALQTGTKYTISFVISSPSEVSNARWYFCTALNRTGVKNYGGYGVKLVTGENIVSQTITVDTSCDAAGLVLYHLPTGCVIKDIQVEKGSSPTGWTPAPEDLQTAILSTKSEISDVSLKVDKNKQAIEQRVEKTTYQQDLNLVKGDISKANEGLNKWRYEIYPKSLFADKPEDQSKYDIGVFIRNKNLTPSRTLVFDDNKWTLLDYENNYIGYGLTFVKMSAKKTFSTKWAHSSSCSIYVNGKLIISDKGTVRLDSNNIGRDFNCTFIEGWNCIEFVMQETTGNEWFFFKDAISAISECQLMNCYYGTPVARQSHITNQLVQNTTDIDGVSTKVSKVTSVIGDNGENFTSFKNDYSDFKQTMNGFKTTVGQTYVTKDDFNGLEIGGRNLVRLGGLSSNGATSFSYDKTTDIYTIVSPVVSTVWGIGAAVKYDDNHKVLIPYGKTYILSFEVKVPQALSINIDINNFAVSGSSWAGNDNDDGSMRGQSSYNIPANTWTKVWVRWANTNTKNTNKVDLYDNSSIGLVTKDCTSAITWQIRHVKGELGNKPTDWTPAPEDVNGKIVNVETIANQTANKFEWIVKGGDSSSNFTLTDRVADLVAERINFKGLITFSGLNTDAKNEIGKVAQSKVDGLEIGGRNLIINSNLSRTLTNVTNDGCSNMTVVSDSVYGHALKFTAVNQRRVFWATSNVWVKNKTYTVSFVAKSSVTGQKIRPSRSTADWGDDITLTTSYARYTTKITSLDTNAGGTLSFSCTNAVGDITITNVKLEVGNKATDWTPAPEDVSQDATNKASQALTDAKNYSSSAVNWVTNNGASTTNLNSMVKKWTDGAVSDTTQINGGWIKANTITASKIAIGDFTNYADINESNTYWFRVEQTKEGTWFYRDGSELQQDNVISELHTCRGGEKFYVEYDISNTIKEGDEYKYAGLMIFGYDGNGGIVSYNRNAGVTATSNGEITHITTQLTMPDTTRSFRVYLQIEGHVPFTGTLKIRNISVRKAVTGNLIVNGSITADKIATDAIKSRNYISSGGTQGSFLNLSDGSFKSPNLSWDSNGNLIAKNANLSGEVTATKGTIGGWNIKDSLYSNVREPYDINKYYAKKILNKPSFTNICMNTNVLSAANYGTVNGDHVTVGDSIIATNTAYSFGVNISLGRISLFGSTYYTSDLASELNKSSSLSLSGDKISFWEYDEDGYEISEQNNTYITSNYARFSGDIFIDGDIGTDGGADIGGKLQASSIAAKNGGLIETSGTIYGGGEIQCGGGQMRIIGGDYGILLRNDGSDFYILSTDSGNQWGYWNSKRPFRINLANGIPYFEYGIIIPNENYLLGNGYQMCRGTSWGGVCIGDDSKGLRFYGTSIWASHSISTSDENLKENFTTLDQYEDFYMNLNPIGFNYIGDYDGKKTHFGFGAHKTEDVLESEGYDSDKFAVVTHRPLVQEDIEKRFGKNIDVDIETEYGVSYTEFIALNTHMIQKTRKELEIVKQEKENLEARLQAIEAKLGL